MLISSNIWLLRMQAHAMAKHWKRRRNAAFIDRLKQRSMLHQETLSLIDHFARRARHGVLEIGAYIGGGTAVAAQALVESGSAAPFVTVEVGGAYPTQPYLPSDDILADLKTTLKDNALSERVTIIEGWSHAAETSARIRTIFTSGIDLLIVDSDGQIARDFALYRDLLVDGAIIVLDDYAFTGGNEKEAPVRAWVDEVTASKLVRPLGVFQWGTWFGRYHGSDSN